jgi:release factor glutamine methyltransferase
MALDGGASGLDCYAQLALLLVPLIKPQGLVFLEIGIGQEADVCRLMEAQGWIWKASHKDLGGIVRCLVFARNHQLASS